MPVAQTIISQNDSLHATSHPPDRLKHLMSMRPYVRQTGDSVRTPWKLDNRRLMDHLLVYIGSGRGVFRLARQGWEVGPGDLFLVPPDTLHAMRGFGKMECVFIHFDLFYDPNRSHWDAYIPGNMLQLGSARVLIEAPRDKTAMKLPEGRLRLPNHSRIRLLMKQICTEHSRSGPEAILILSGLMTALIGEILRFTDADLMIEPAVWQKMEQAADRIRAQVRAPFDLKSVCRVTGYSPSHFRKLFHRIYGQSPRAMHGSLRIQKARDLLQFSTWNISQIADYLGFSTVQNFSRAFFQASGQRPTDFRQGQRRTVEENFRTDNDFEVSGSRALWQFRGNTV